jgi:hypothetical protein
VSVLKVERLALVVDKAAVKEDTLVDARVLREETADVLIDISDDNAVDKEETDELVADNALEVEVLKEETALLLVDISVESEDDKEDTLVEVIVLKEETVEIVEDKRILCDAKLINSELSIALIAFESAFIILKSMLAAVVKALFKYSNVTASVGLTGVANPVNVVFGVIEIT